MTQETKHAGGRPSEWDPEFIKKAEWYLQSWQERGEVVPTIEGLCRVLGKTKQTILEYEKQHEEFSYALARIRSEQAFQLQNKGLAGQTNSVITKLMLSANHGMREKNDLELSGKDGNPIDTAITVTVKHV